MRHQFRVALYRRLVAGQRGFISLNAAGIGRPYAFMRVGDLLMLRIQILAHCRNMRAFRTAAVSRPGMTGSLANAMPEIKVAVSAAVVRKSFIYQTS